MKRKFIVGLIIAGMVFSILPTTLSWCDRCCDDDVHIWTDKSSYCIGERINIYFRLDNSGETSISIYIWLTDYLPSGSSKYIIYDQEVEGNKTYTISGVVEGTPGTERLVLYAEFRLPEGMYGGCSGESSCSFQVKECGCEDGFLWIHCNEYEYDLYVDGKYKFTEGHGSGQSTSSKPDGICGVKLSAGDHTIKLKKDGCDSVTKTVHLDCGEEKTVYLDMDCDPCKNKNCDQYDGFVGEKYCKNGDVYQKYRDYYCEDGECKYSEEERKIKDCDYGCESGGCKPKPTTPPPTTQPPTTPPPTTVAPTPPPTTHPPTDLDKEIALKRAEAYEAIYKELDAETIAEKDIQELIDWCEEQKERAMGATTGDLDALQYMFEL
ncbi:MAG TPA: hypothetical protein ENI49_04800, partial [Thermoplasmatales archaeon]|nr:hypothetical protein [Thermoplasmatales archaeon]